MAQTYSFLLSLANHETVPLLSGLQLRVTGHAHPISSGVCVRDPYTRDVWTDPEAPCVREAMKMGIPLAVKIEGPGANGFTLDVTGPVGTSHGGDSARCQGKGVR